MREKICEIGALKKVLTEARSAGKKVVFTNGCFDILHRGHLHLLREAKKLGDLLVVGLNSDSSVKSIKGPGRPVLSESDRAELIAALEMVDYVILFGEPDPLRLIRELRPDILVKGGDWEKQGIVGAAIVESAGGKVVLVEYLRGCSTTDIIERMRNN